MSKEDTTDASPRLLKSDASIATLLALIVIITLLFLQPLADVPKNDDFSWARTAEVFAHTGKVVYNGWGNPILLPHTWVGAGIIKLFGFSYISLSLFGIASGAAFAVAVYLLARQCGISKFVSALVVAILTLNPIFLGVTPTFMSDVPTAFLCVASLLAFAHALQPVSSPDSRKQFTLRLLPFGVAVLLAFLAGANRQLFWPTLLVAFLCVWPYLTPTDRIRKLIPGLLLVTIGAVALSAWFNQQPGTLSLSLERATRLIQAGRVATAVLWPYKLLNLAGIALLPIALLAAYSRWQEAAQTPEGQRRYTIRLASALIVSIAALALFYFLPDTAMGMRRGNYGITGFGQYLTERGTQIGGLHGFEFRPVIIPPILAHLLYAAGAIGLGVAAFLFLLPPRVTHESEIEPLKASLMIRAALITALVQIVVPLPWYASGSCYDRYLISVLPGILLFCAAQVTIDLSRGRPVLLVATILPVAYAISGLLFATEYFASVRGRTDLFTQLLQRGIRREEIDAGLELCCDTQILKEGWINRAGQKSYDPIRQGNASSVAYLYPAMDAYLMLSYAPSAPDLSGSNSRNALTVDPKPVLVTEYDSLLPPAKRSIYIYRIRKGDLLYRKLIPQ